MKEDIDKLEKEFQRIKAMGQIKSMRKGSTGLGYTFETLLNKKEDQESKPDFGSIEIKCKLGFTKYPVVLFNLAPMRNDEYATRYIFENYKYRRYNNPNDIFIYFNYVFSHFAYRRNNLIFRLKVDYEKNCLIMKVYKNGVFLEDVCYWDFKDLEERLKGKISTMAIVYAYPYNKEDGLYYRYLKMNIYKLKSFEDFLKLIECDDIFVTIYLKEEQSSLGNPKLVTHGVSFSIKKEAIPKLFTKIKSDY